ncbi:translocation protein TolB [Gemmata obscuriglobus]|uniref:Pyrrolo-quinoline quinone repeat domain-containing protein n=1 Tax=Gemmata obscuriglobus TaxID=114 RepID=A0A2Z3GW93_9BACT|nr:WD40 repeat domain-containing protein [Gemmata obscuriglobus]AWM36861.1 hypothetical protein C1280_07405 [Gemmata obscuriglobus]QEG30467.1 translocation protein TolB [Gemmata obscuriglobus]VTS09791.1 (myosin heavy-chain) kinase : WD-40 repeat protein OS=Lyngbya sp. (strain PCC 8106) GN=L8106_17667 PE=4 SV=1: PQQ_2 [Gemmata obscuriglobus UQM 2246]
MRVFGVFIGVAVLCGAVPAADPPGKKDRYGDPLPDGARMRFGTVRGRAPISGFGIEKDGTVVTAGMLAEVRRWRATRESSEEPLFLPLPEPVAIASYPQVSPDGRLVAVCSQDKLSVWEAPVDGESKPKCLAEFAAGRPRLFRFSPDGSKLILTTASSGVSSVLLCDIQSGQATALGGGDGYFEAVNFSGDGKRAAGVVGRKVVLWDTASGRTLADHQLSDWLAGTFALDSAGQVLVARVYLDGGKSEWRAIDPLTGKLRDGFKGPPGGRWAAYAPDGKTLLVGDLKGITWWDPAAGQAVRAFDVVASGGGLQDVPARLTPDGKVLVAHNGHMLMRWDAATGKPLFRTQDDGHNGYVNGLGVSPDGKLIATRGLDSRVCVWDTATGKEVWRTAAQWSSAPYLVFAPNGKHLYLPGPGPGEVTRYDALAGKIAGRFVVDLKEGGQGGVVSIRLSADGKTLHGLSRGATADDSGLLTTWDTATAARVNVARLTDPRQSDWGELSPGAQFIAEVGYGRGGVVALGSPDKNLLADAKVPGHSLLLSGHFSDDGKWFTLVTHRMEDGVAKYAAVVVSTPIWRVTATVPIAQYGAAALSPDGRTLAVAAADQLEFYDAATAEWFGGYRLPVTGWERPGNRFTHVLRFTPDGTRLISGHLDTTALVWAVPARPKK